MFKKFFAEPDALGTLGYNHPGLGNGNGGSRAQPDDGLTQVDLARQIDVDHFGIDIANAKPDGKPGKGGGGNGGGGGGGGGTVPDPYISGPADSSAGFNIKIVFEGEWSQALYDIFVAAADFYTALIVGDLQDVTVTSGRGKKATTNTIDDIEITASLITIDGSGGVLGRAGPTAVRTDNSLPATAIMEFDIADAGDFTAAGLFDDIVLHEMGHALGFGTIWDRLGLINPDNTFGGALAQAESLALFGTSDIAIETDGGQGTAFGHWDDATYTNELMTGYISDPNYFSYMSAASYGDLGYELASNYRMVVDELNTA
ncbi:leishmanolysin-related zinc metalloendopeptidase [Erythrobacter alti]|uniref:leishmanolysin-related zinc metalloendopeptidase n=1 Tax=Erythrobacter alti TaxID=1896145 RepID=UPI0030F39806